MSLFWLSFADDSLPTGGQFLGVAIVESDAALGICGAVSEAHRLKINPGGQVVSWEVPEASRARYEPLAGRLLSRAELDKAFGDVKTVGELMAEDES